MRREVRNCRSFIHLDDARTSIPEYELEVFNTQRPYKAYLTWYGDETHPHWHALLRYTDDNPVNPRTTYPTNLQFDISIQ